MSNLVPYDGSFTTEARQQTVDAIKERIASTDNISELDVYSILFSGPLTDKLNYGRLLTVIQYCERKANDTLNCLGEAETNAASFEYIRKLLTIYSSYKAVVIFLQRFIKY